MSIIENAARCNRCRKDTMDWIKDRWIAVVGRIWVGQIKQVDSDASTGHYCSWKCLGGQVAVELDNQGQASAVVASAVAVVLPPPQKNWAA